jgi:hypothetical protein
MRILEKLKGRRSSSIDIQRTIVNQLTEGQQSSREQVLNEVAQAYQEVEEIWYEIQQMKKDVVVNSLLEMLIIYRNIQFPVNKPELPQLNIVPPNLEIIDDNGLLTSFRTQLFLGLLNLVNKEKYLESKQEQEIMREQRNKQRRKENKKNAEKFEDYLRSLGDFKKQSLEDLNGTREQLLVICNRLKELKLMVENGYSIKGPQLIKGESSELDTVFTIPFSGKFDLTQKDHVYIKIGAANENELKKKKKDIPQLKLTVSCHIEGGTISYSVEKIGLIPLTIDLENGRSFASGAIGQSAAIQIVNDISIPIRETDNDFEEDYDNRGSIRSLEIPYAFATEMHIAENIALQIYQASKGSISVKPTDILHSLVMVTKQENTYASKKLLEMLNFGKANAQNNMSWAQGGNNINADILEDVGMGDNIGVRKLIIMLRTGALRQPWEYAIGLLAVGEGRHDLLNELYLQKINPTQLFLKLDSSKQVNPSLGGGAMQLFESQELEDEIYDEEDPDRALELSPQGAFVLNTLQSGARVSTAQQVKIRHYARLVMNPGFQKGALKLEDVQDRNELHEKIGNLMTKIGNAKLRAASAVLQLELDSLEKAVADFKKEADQLKPAIAAGILSMMTQRASQLSIEIPDYNNIRVPVIEIESD